MILPALAVVAAVSHLLAEDALGPFGPAVKAIPVLVLAVLVFRAQPQPGQRPAVSALAISALADMVIEFSFLGGLATFLVAHLFYIAAFTRIESRPRPRRLVPVLLWAVLVLPVLVRHAGPLAGPVLIYGLVIFGMIWRAAAAVAALGMNNATIALVGAVFFGISDTLLGYSRFVAAVPLSGSAVMGTYWSGQFLIALSFLRGRQGSGV